MESNECICLNYLLSNLQKMINSLLSTTSTVMMNTNTPATDSGYLRNEGGNGQDVTSPGNFNSYLNTTFYTFLIIVALMLLMTRLRKGANNSKLSK